MSEPTERDVCVRCRRTEARLWYHQGVGGLCDRCHVDEDAAQVSLSKSVERRATQEQLREEVRTTGIVEERRGHTVDYDQKPASDAINPTHYKADPSGIECIEVTRHRNFNIGNAIKYLWRLGLKDIAPSAQDLRKAIWYLEDELGIIEGKGTHAGQNKQ